VVKSPGTIVWFRQDLRLHDNPALAAALARGGWVLPVYILCDQEQDDWPAGGASRWWLHQSLSALQAAMHQRGSRLLLRRAAALDVISELVRQSGADAVYWNRRYEPAGIARDSAVKQALRGNDIVTASFNGALLAEPWDVRSPSDKSYRVFTPFKKRLLECIAIPSALALAAQLPAPPRWPDSCALEALELLPTVQWYRAMSGYWQPGESGANRRAAEFLTRPMSDYAAARDTPAIDATSRLSPHLHFGEISVRQLWRDAQSAAKRQRLEESAWHASTFASELIWREFAHHLLYHHPRTALEPLDQRFERFPWRADDSTQRIWQRGLTGFPIVDAGMRQLWALGWMHNRVRMIVASMLIKNLGQPWLQGARWFWDTLVDADLAANTLNWQWSAGCGADAAPFFRIFNPVTQGEKFDPDGEYVRRWVPELAALPAQYIHVPHLAPPQVLRAAGVRIGATYPAPLVDLKQSRQQALAAYRAMRET
jgi:deoxyribodipyrimidine photo-lyase